MYLGDAPLGGVIANIFCVIVGLGGIKPAGGVEKSNGDGGTPNTGGAGGVTE